MCQSLFLGMGVPKAGDDPAELDAPCQISSSSTWKSSGAERVARSNTEGRQFLLGRAS